MRFFTIYFSDTRISSTFKETNMAEDMPEYTAEELKKYNGQNGNPVYIVYGDKVYDVSESKMWKTGMHMRRHPSGMDLSSELGEAPHGEEVFERFQQVGTFKRAEPEGEAAEPLSHLPGFLAKFLERYPVFERHTHPSTVHFPIAFLIVGPLFGILYLIFRLPSFEVTTEVMVGTGTLFALLSISTGFYAWWVNYMLRPIRRVIIKIVTSSLTFTVGLIVFIWRLADPTVLTNLRGVHVIWFILLLLLIPLVTTVGTQGALLTFPVSERPEKRSDR